MLGLLVWGCSSGGGTNPSNNLQPLTSPTFAGPTPKTTNGDTAIGVLAAQLDAASLNVVFQDYLEFFSGQGTQNGNTWTWIKQSSTLTATADLTVNGSNYTLSLTFNGTYENQNYGDAIVMSGTESSDGKNGSWSIATPAGDGELDWSTDSHGTLTGTFTSTDSDNEKDILTNKADGSGEFQEYNGSAVKLDVTWSSNGSGQWVAYDPTTGNQIGSGSWS